MNKLRNIVIVAGGENTRFNEMSIFPKVLLPTLEFPSILSYNCDLFKDYNIYLIINNRYDEMTKQYIDKTKLNINLLVSDNHNGSANTIKALIDQLPKENILFVWSDLILDKIGLSSIEEGIKESTKSNIVFTYSGKYRFKATDEDIVPTTTDGNVPGLYYCKSLSSIYENYIEKDNFDYLEIIREFGKDKYQTKPYLGHIVEFRDLETYLDYYKSNSNKTSTRFFNKISIKNHILTKKCINENYNHLIDREINWYLTCYNNKYINIPQIYHTSRTEHFIKMEYLDGYMNIYEFIKNCNDKEFQRFMKSYIKAINNLHKLNKIIVSEEEAYNDFYIEFYEKVIKRCNSISSILYNYDISELEELLDKAFNRIIDLIGKDKLGVYSFTHGDLNGSNVMYNKELDLIKFIDPRGYFGKTQLVGPASYDFAKVAYCLSGYDEFNNGNFKFTSKWYDEPKELRKYEFRDNNELYYIMVGIIWIALAEYISQDVFKANIAYRHGIKLLKEYIS